MVQADGRLYLVAVLAARSRPAETAHLALGPELFGTSCRRVVAGLGHSLSVPQLEGKTIRYGRKCCPRTIEILGGHAGVMTDPTLRKGNVKDVIRAVRKVYPA